jgi:hypothetical protein
VLGRHEVHTIVQDLIYLRRWLHNPPDDEIRRGRAILRRLLVERELGNAWRSSGFEKEPHIIAVDLAAKVLNHSGQFPELALAGGGSYKDWQIACTVLWKNSKPNDLQSAPVERAFSLSQYLESPAGLILGETISRRKVIKYMANVRGGVHLETAKARREERAFISHISTLEGAVNMFVMNGLLYELLSIGQAVAQAPDSNLLIETFARNRR